MKLFKSLAARETERQVVFAEPLRSDRAREVLFERFVGFLWSQEGREVMFKLLADARLPKEVEAAIASANGQFTDHMGTAARQLRDQIHAETACWREEIPKRAADMRQGLEKDLIEHEREIIELTRVSTLKAIEEVLVAYLHDMLKQQVRAFVKVHPVRSGLSNRELIAAGNSER
jgi:hypothetical protein